MTANKRFKREVRARAAKSGQTYSTALLHLRQTGEFATAGPRLAADEAAGAAFTRELQAAIDSAWSLARQMGHANVTTEHLVLGALAHPECAAARVLNDQGASFDMARRLIDHGETPAPPARLSLAARTADVLEAGVPAIASVLGHSEAGTDHLLVALVEQYEVLANRFFDFLRVDADEVRRAIEAAWLLHDATADGLHDRATSKQPGSEATATGVGADVDVRADNRQRAQEEQA
jgi:ATP-dependent Clp protease ATP-binding subunit ClpA